MNSFSQVFVNSIASVLRLGGLFDVLNCNPMRMHSKMQQRQRLKNLDRFSENENSLMIASDVLARGWCFFVTTSVFNLKMYPLNKNIELSTYKFIFFSTSLNKFNLKNFLTVLIF